MIRATFCVLVPAKFTTIPPSVLARSVRIWFNIAAVKAADTQTAPASTRVGRLTTAPAIVKPMPRRAAAACGIWPTYCPPKPGAARSTTARSPIAGATRSQRSEPVEASAACNNCKN